MHKGTTETFWGFKCKYDLWGNGPHTTSTLEVETHWNRENSQDCNGIGMASEVWGHRTLCVMCIWKKQKHVPKISGRLHAMEPLDDWHLDFLSLWLMVVRALVVQRNSGICNTTKLVGPPFWMFTITKMTSFSLCAEYTHMDKTRENKKFMEHRTRAEWMGFYVYCTQYFWGKRAHWSRVWYYIQ